MNNIWQTIRYREGVKREGVKREKSREA